MGRIRLNKVLRDLWVARGRMALMVGAVATSLVAAGATLGAYAIMSREMNRAYAATLPAAATLDTHGVTPELVAQVAGLPNISGAQGRSTVQGRVQVGGDWRPLVLFVVPDFASMTMARVEHVSGAWPPPTGTMLVERVALAVLEASVGATVLVKPPNAPATTLAVSGVAYDAGVAPATMERTVYGYITPDTQLLLGQRGGLDELKITVLTGGASTLAIEGTASAVAAWLAKQGHVVHTISVPPPGRHPHQGQMNAVMVMLNAFSLVSLLLSGILVAAVMAALMARQGREIGVLKAMGASSAQVAVMYAAMVAALGGLAALLALIPGAAAAQLMSASAARGLNIELLSNAIPPWVFAVQVAAGVLVPLFTALVPVVQASTRSVQDALTAAPSAVTAAPDWALRLGNSVQSAPVRLGLRNTLRNRTRLLMNVALLAAGGAMFITAANVREAWGVRLAEVGSSRSHDLEVQFQHATPGAPLEQLLQALPGVTRAEAWGLQPASPGTTVGPQLNHAYPDRGHGVFRVLGAPVDTTLIHLPLLEGRWLAPTDTNTVVLNHLALPAFPHAQPGSTITVTVEDRVLELVVVGVARDLGSPATLYVPRHVLPGQHMVRVQTSATHQGERARIIRAVQDALDQQGHAITQALPVAELKSAVGEHMAVLLGVLLALAATMTLVGALGLMAAMGIAVVERTRELGVMLAVGATPSTILAVLLAEGVVVGLLSAVGAWVLAVPLSLGVGTVIGTMAFRLPLPVVMSPLAAFIWLLAVLVLAGVATAVPARAAAQRTVRDALAYV